MDQPSSKLHFGWGVEEQARLWYLSRFPHAVLVARNFRSRMGEIDLIFEELGGEGHPELVFIEVRARLPGSWQGGVESVGARKLGRLKGTIAVFMTRYRGQARTARMDILAWDGQSWEHLENVWT